MWHCKVWRAGNGYRLALSSIFRAIYVWLYPTSKEKDWNSLRSGFCTDELLANLTQNFFPLTCFTKHKKHDRREPGLFKEEFRCTECICLCSKRYCCYDSQRNEFRSSCKGLNKRTLGNCGNGPMSNYSKVPEEFVNLTPTNWSFRTIQFPVATNEQAKKGLSYFYPERHGQQHGIHTLPLSINP